MGYTAHDTDVIRGLRVHIGATKDEEALMLRGTRWESWATVGEDRGERGRTVTDTAQRCTGHDIGATNRISCAYWGHKGLGSADVSMMTRCSRRQARSDAHPPSLPRGNPRDTERSEHRVWRRSVLRVHYSGTLGDPSVKIRSRVRHDE